MSVEVEASGNGLTRLMLFSIAPDCIPYSVEEERESIAVCPKRRYELTTHYQKLKSSHSHPSHGGETKKLKNPRRVNKKVSEEIYQEFHVSVPIGSGKYNKPILRLFPHNSTISGN